MILNYKTVYQDGRKNLHLKANPPTFNVAFYVYLFLMISEKI